MRLASSSASLMVPAAVAFAFEMISSAERCAMMSAWAMALSSAFLASSWRSRSAMRASFAASSSSLDARRRVETGERGVVQLALQLVYLRGHRVDLVGNVLQKHVHFVDIVALAVDREALVVDISRGDCHSRSLRPVRADAVQAQLKQVYYQTYPEL